VSFGWGGFGGYMGYGIMSGVIEDIGIGEVGIGIRIGGIEGIYCIY
jgi:hypothetical protein